ncbi:YfjP family GTPase [Streptomyces sp. NBRC 110611]|uniref:YfjP family GTPase n=1 Tax=Streptomyces sp. NBRC 110611 TaxID=1621259 RepID=UPI00215BCD7D
MAAEGASGGEGAGGESWVASCAESWIEPQERPRVDLRTGSGDSRTGSRGRSVVAASCAAVRTGSPAGSSYAGSRGASCERAYADAEAVIQPRVPADGAGGADSAGGAGLGEVESEGLESGGDVRGAWGGGDARSVWGAWGGGAVGYRWVADGGRPALGGRLRERLEALRELLALSRSRLDGRTLEAAGRVLEVADERYRLSGEHTVVAIAGATGSGKSSLFNALAGANRSQVGPRRPTTAEPVACVWPGGRPGAEGLLHRLGVPAHRRHVPADSGSELRGLVLIDLPDHDSSATEHRAQVDRMLELVDAVIWVVDPEKYADAVLHERYLRPMAGYAEVMFVVLNQADRLPGDAADQVVDDLRRLLDEDGLALGEHGEPGAAVFALSAATGRGVAELREALGGFVAERGAADRRLAADVDAAAERLRSVYVARSGVGLTERAREEFDDQLAEAVGAAATGRAAERDWLRHAERACGSPWVRMRMRGRRERQGSTGGVEGEEAGAVRRGAEGGRTGPGESAADGRVAARPVVEQAVRAVSGEAARGLPAPWALAVREAAERGARGLPEALDGVADEVEESLRGGPAVKPWWWTVAASLQVLMSALQVFGVLWLLGAVTGVGGAVAWVSGLLSAVVGSVGGPVLAWLCRVVARGPARRYGQDAERRLRSAVAGRGRAHVLEPVAAELLRYREVREQYAVASGG